MFRNTLRKGIGPLIITLAVGLFAVWFIKQPDSSERREQTMPSVERGSGASGPDFGSNPPDLSPPSEDAPNLSTTSAVRVTSKPRAQYTDEARTHDVQGVVRLKITLLANGEVGSITPLSELPFGLTEQAIAAAKQIKFEPRKVNGVPQSSVVTFEYSFTIY